MKTREGGLDLEPGRVPHGPCKGSEVILVLWEGQREWIQEKHSSGCWVETRPWKYKTESSDTISGAATAA